VHHGGEGSTPWRPGLPHQREEGASSPSLNPATGSGLEEDAAIDDEVHREKEAATSLRRASSPDHAAMLRLVRRGKGEGRESWGRRKASRPTMRSPRLRPLPPLAREAAGAGDGDDIPRVDSQGMEERTLLTFPIQESMCNNVWA
jgi:hypothetical protein